MTLSEHMKKFVSAWKRGSWGLGPKAMDDVSLRGHAQGKRASERAIDKELEKLGLVLGPETIRQVAAEAADDLASLTTEEATAESPLAAPIPSAPDPLLEKFAEIRDRAMVRTAVPCGTEFPREYDEKTGERLRPQPGLVPVKHAAPRATPRIIAREPHVTTFVGYIPAERTAESAPDDENALVNLYPLD